MKQEYSIVVVEMSTYQKVDLNMLEKLDVEIKEKSPKEDMLLRCRNLSLNRMFLH